MAIEPWQIPVLAMAVIVGPTSAYWAFRWFRSRSPVPPVAPPDRDQPGGPARTDSVGRRSALERRRLLIFATLTVVLVVICIISIGQEAANTLITAVSAVPALVSAILSVHSIFLLQELQKERQQEREPASDDARPGSD